MGKPKIDKNIEVPISILKQLLTTSEIRMLKNRWQIIQQLRGGLSVRKVAEKVKVGTDTVVRVSRMMEKGRISQVLEEQETNRKFKSQTPWIFGKNN